MELDPKSYVDGQRRRHRLRSSRNRGVRDRKRGNRTLNFSEHSLSLIASDAKTGNPTRTFGDNGVVDLSQGGPGRSTKCTNTATSPLVSL